MNNNIVIFIWEWNSEISFFQEFLKKKYNISWENIKNLILYKVWNNLIIFAHPIMWNTEHRWWDNTFNSAKTYIDINKKISSCKYEFQKDYKYNFVYLFLTDKDKSNSENKLNWVNELILKFCSAYKWDIIPVFAIKEIETWFLAGLGKEFIENYKWIDLDELEKFYKKDIETFDDTKEFLRDVILKNTDISSSQTYIWREFWKYIDIQQAKSKSKSFNEFVKILDWLLG